MSVEYRITPADAHYTFSYRGLREDFERFCSMSDAEFLQSLPDILHYACFVSWLKELGIDATLSDEGIIHQLVHLLASTEGPSVEIGRIRRDFVYHLRLA